MRRVLLIIAAVACTTLTMAQSVIVVNSETIFKSIAEYNNALSQIEQLSNNYQSLVDAKYAAVESSFNSYAAAKSSYSAAQRTQAEAKILAAESAATKLQQAYFGEEGLLMKRRVELITPIQNRVFAVIEEYAQSRGAEVVLDSATNPSLLYSSSAADHTQAIIKLLQ